MPSTPPKLPIRALPQSSKLRPTAPNPEQLDIRASPLFRKRRTFVLAGGVAVITIAGTLIGASFKTSQQVVEKKTLKQQIEVDTAKQVHLLEATRGQLMQQKVGLERKIEELNARRERTRALEMEKGRMRGLDPGNVRDGNDP